MIGSQVSLIHRRLRDGSKRKKQNASAVPALNMARIRPVAGERFEAVLVAAALIVNVAEATPFSAGDTGFTLHVIWLDEGVQVRLRMLSN